MYLGRRRGARMEGVLMAQRTDGSGVELLRATSWFMQEFNTAEWPIPRDSRNPDGSKKIGQYGFPGRGHGRTAGRVVYTPPPDWDGKNLPRARFSWGRVVPSETWYVLAELLRVSYGQIFFLATLTGTERRPLALVAPVSSICPAAIFIRYSAASISSLNHPQNTSSLAGVRSTTLCSLFVPTDCT